MEPVTVNIHQAKTHLSRLVGVRGKRINSCQGRKTARETRPA